MKLNSIFEALTFGELSQHKLGGKKDGAIAQADYPAILSHLNLAMEDLHIKFPLIKKELLLRQWDSINHYEMTLENAVSQTPLTPYIIDSVEEPFEEDVARIYAVVDGDGNTITVNDEDLECPIYTPTYSTLHITDPVQDEEWIIKYHATPSEIVIPDPNDISGVNVPLPGMYKEPLLCYIAARVYSSANTETSNQASGFYYNKYNALCNQLTLRNTTHTDTDNTGNRMERMGWT